jgi:hypothetical protein
MAEIIQEYTFNGLVVVRKSAFQSDALKPYDGQKVVIRVDGPKATAVSVFTSSFAPICTAILVTTEADSITAQPGQSGTAA